MSEYVGWCPVHGSLWSTEIEYRGTRGHCLRDDSPGLHCYAICTGPGADAALAALRERDDLATLLEETDTHEALQSLKKERDKLRARVAELEINEENASKANTERAYLLADRMRAEAERDEARASAEVRGKGCQCGDDEACACVEERDAYRAALLDCRQWVDDSETWGLITESFPKGWDK